MILMEKSLLGVKRVAELLGISERTVWNIIKSGELKKITVGHSVKVHPDDLQAYLEKNRS